MPKTVLRVATGMMEVVCLVLWLRCKHHRQQIRLLILSSDPEELEVDERERWNVPAR